MSSTPNVSAADTESEPRPWAYAQFMQDSLAGTDGQP